MKVETIRIELTDQPNDKPDWNNLQFGRTFTDHMFVMDYTPESGWHDARIIPYGDLPMSPASSVLHYGQTVFEGLKAYRDREGNVSMFRPDQNMKRMNDSNERLCMPAFDGDFVIEAMKVLIDVDREWVPDVEGTALYIRPVLFATSPNLGVDPSANYRMIIMMSPVGAYYEGGINPVKIAVESDYVRAVKGGTGAAKTAGNYASSLKAQQEAKKKGYEQVLWLDGREHRYVEEVGAMNVFFKIDGEIVTPELNGSILPGVTRRSVIELLQHWGEPVVERRLAMQEIYDAAREGKLEEAFGTGTAAVISPIGELYWNEEQMVINEGKIGSLSQKIYDTITGIQSGEVEDPFGWRVDVPKRG